LLRFQFGEIAGRDKSAYFHEAFLRGKRFLSTRIKRIKRIKGSKKIRLPSFPETEPNFYDMPYLPDTDVGMQVHKKQQVVAPLPHAPSLAQRGSLVNIEISATDERQQNIAVPAVSSNPVSSTPQMDATADRLLLVEWETRSNNPSLTPHISAVRDTPAEALQSLEQYSMPSPRATLTDDDWLEQSRLALDAAIQFLSASEAILPATASNTVHIKD
jgi:hypothetical protein